MCQAWHVKRVNKYNTHDCQSGIQSKVNKLLQIRFLDHMYSSKLYVLTSIDWLKLF